MLARPWTTSSRRRAAIHGTTPHCEPIVSTKLPGGPCVTVTGSRTNSIGAAQSPSITSSGTSEDTNAVSAVPGSTVCSARISSRA